ncbi:hypothetical protein P3W45_000491 [Vairimorpha bombi]|jgi:hypothetical protein
MDFFENINQTRHKYNFPSKEYKAITLKSKDNLINKIELNTCKYYLLNSRKYLKKNIKLLKSLDLPLYTEYTKCLLSNNVEDILKLRSKLESFDTFVDEIDNLLNNLNFDINKIKSKYIWNDIEILFNTEKKKNDYINNEYKVSDKKYNSLLIIYITRLENKLKGLKGLIKKDNTRIDCISKKLNVVDKVLDKFMNFLRDNYVESRYLDNLKKETDLLINIYKNIKNTGEVTPVELSVYADIKDQIFSSKIMKDKKSLRSELIEYLTNYFSQDKEYKNVPFLPDFYDIAYDYIEYPSTDKNINELLSKMDVN